MKPNATHSILRPSLGTSYNFQRLLHHSFDRYYITPKLILPKEKDVVKEIGHVHNCTLSFRAYTPSDFKIRNVMYSLSFSYTSIAIFKNKQNAYKKTIHRLLTQDARITISEVKGKDSDIIVKKNNREKEVFLVLSQA